VESEKCDGGPIMKTKHVQGEKKGNLVLYALSTCVWCKKTKEFLNDLSVDYDYVNVDELPDPERDEAVTALKRWNPRCSFPSLVVNEESCIIGFNEEKIKEALNL
jgi:glutaredoxin-like protein NrdH